MMGAITHMVFKKQRRTINNLMEHGVGNVKVISNSSKFDELFRTLDDGAKGMLLMALQLDKKDMENVLYKKLTEVAKEKNIELKREDMPEMVKELFTQRNLDKTLKGINSRGKGA